MRRISTAAGVVDVLALSKGFCSVNSKREARKEFGNDGGAGGRQQSLQLAQGFLPHLSAEKSRGFKSLSQLWTHTNRVSSSPAETNSKPAKNGSCREPRKRWRLRDPNENQQGSSGRAVFTIKRRNASSREKTQRQSGSNTSNAERQTRSNTIRPLSTRRVAHEPRRNA